MTVSKQRFLNFLRNAPEDNLRQLQRRLEYDPNKGYTKYIALLRLVRRANQGKSFSDEVREQWARAIHEISSFAIVEEVEFFGHPIQYRIYYKNQSYYVSLDPSSDLSTEMDNLDIVIWILSDHRQDKSKNDIFRSLFEWFQK